jgi:uncharacterized damage-inducible protein DinB
MAAANQPAGIQPAPPLPAALADMLACYARGAAELRSAVAGMTEAELHAHPVAGRWSTHQVVCHLADAELLYSDRIRRVLAEDRPTLPGLDPDLHVSRLAIPARRLEDELALVDYARRQMLAILHTLTAADFAREGIHTEAGPLTVEALLKRVTDHVPHHVKFIVEKRAALKA